jgi:hypothetical protein
VGFLATREEWAYSVAREPDGNDCCWINESQSESVVYRERSDYVHSNGRVDQCDIEGVRSARLHTDHRDPDGYDGYLFGFDD